MAIQRKKVCKVCNEYFITSQINAKYCSDGCRTKDRSQRQSDRKLKTANNRIAKIPTSEEWLWLAREAKRAGTIEVLHGHTAATLEQLFALRNYRFKCFGWDSDKKVSKFHLCHMQPSNGNNSVGLLHPHNIFVGGSLPNQVHGTKSYDGVGLSLSRYNLKPKWLVSKEDTDKAVLAKVEKYLGKVIVDYAKKNPIRKSQRLSQAEWIKKNIPDCPYTLNELERKGIQELREMRAAFEEKDLYQMDLTARRSFLVYMDECQRLSEQLPDCRHKSDLAWLVPVMRVACAFMSREGEEGFASVLSVPFHVNWTPLKLRDGMDSSTFRNFISFQAFQALQGAPVDRKMVLNTIRKYLDVPSLVPDWSKVPDGCYKYLKDEYDRFPPQIKPLQDAILTLELANPLLVHDFLEGCKEALRETEWFESHEWAVCESEDDYSGMYYEVGDSYIPNPNLRTVKKPIYVDF